MKKHAIKTKMLKKKLPGKTEKWLRNTLMGAGIARSKKVTNNE